MKFSIVTPSYNSSKFITETIESVISQSGDFEIEYILMDNSSSDATLEIIEKYVAMMKENRYEINCRAVNIIYKSEKDNGMYDAINKGFKLATGNIYAWINADDIYLPGAFEKIRKVFEIFKEVKWVKGITSYIDESSRLYQEGKCHLYAQNLIKYGVYGREGYFIQQDSVFWNSEIWKRSGGIDSSLKMAGDYSLWIKFSNLTPLYSINEKVSCFRKVEGQKSQDFDSYKKEYENIIIPNYLLSRKASLFFNNGVKIPFRFLRRAFHMILFGKQKYFLVNFCNGKPEMETLSYYEI